MCTAIGETNLTQLSTPRLLIARGERRRSSDFERKSAIAARRLFVIFARHVVVATSFRRTRKGNETGSQWTAVDKAWANAVVSATAKVGTWTKREQTRGEARRKRRGPLAPHR